ncbi:MAG: class I SAM-dependent methyltransferase [Betaproteobacteria bacterium]|nr:class I SAM-dependent methyltransferase [Betaproteobacteria bacterium]
MTWWDDAAFNDYLRKFQELDGNNSDRRYLVSQLLRLTAAVPGDTAEVGVFQGAMSWLILRANAGQRQHHLFDSFEGLSNPNPVDGNHWTQGALACGEEAVRRNLAEFRGHFRSYKGWVPERFHEIEDHRFSFVHIDVDLYEPTRASLEFFYPRMCPGGIIVCDDYNFTTCPGATRAVNDFLADRPEKMVGLSAGGGFLIAGTVTASSTGAPGPGQSSAKARA